MKKILSIIMLLGVLCLAGCSEEVPQNVFFDKEEATVTSFENSVNVGISADCKWNIQVTSGNPTVSVMSGEGQAFITVTVRNNKTYDGIDHTIVITSENGKSSDSFTIHQWPLLETTADSPLVSCEGGSFDVKMKSSDTFSNVETPDWITFTSSRAMKDYVYSFTAEPNKTGKMRTGSVWLKGMLIHEEIIIKQSPYSPTSVTLGEIPEHVFAGEKFELNVSPEPEYADDSNISVKVLRNGKEVESTFEYNRLQFYPSYSGEYTLEFYEGAKLLRSEVIKVLNGDIHMSLSCGESCLVGDTINVMVDIPMDMCSIKADGDKGALEKISETTYVVKKEGVFYFTATNILSGRKDQSSVNASFVISNSWRDIKPSLSDGKVLATFYTEVISNLNMNFVHVYIYGPDGYLVMKDNSFVSLEKNLIFIKSFEIPIERGKYTIWVELSINGEPKHIVNTINV